MMIRGKEVRFDSQGTEAEGGIFSDLSGGHEYEEYMSLYSQGTEDCREGIIFSDLSGGHECEEYLSLYVLPRD
jgi:hypothetical protein